MDDKKVKLEMYLNLLKGYLYFCLDEMTIGRHDNREIAFCPTLAKPDEYLISDINKSEILTKKGLQLGLYYNWYDILGIGKTATVFITRIKDFVPSMEKIVRTSSNVRGLRKSVSY